MKMLKKRLKQTHFKLKKLKMNINIWKFKNKKKKKKEKNDDLINFLLNFVFLSLTFLQKTNFNIINLFSFHSIFYQSLY